MTPTHAYVGYNTHDTPVLVAVEDGSRDTAHTVQQVLAAGGRVERMTLEAARAVKLYERPSDGVPRAVTDEVSTDQIEVGDG